jgi:WD40 repeat protein
MQQPMYRFDPSGSINLGSSPGSPPIASTIPVAVPSSATPMPSGSGSGGSGAPPRTGLNRMLGRSPSTTASTGGLGFYVGEVGNLLPEPMRAYIPEPLLGAAAKTDARLLVLWKDFQVFDNRLYLVLGLLQGIQVYQIRQSSTSGKGSDADVTYDDPVFVRGYYPGCIAAACFVGTTISKKKEYVSRYSPALALTSAEDNADFPRHEVRFYSLRNGCLFDQRKFRSRVHGVCTGPKNLIVGLKTELHVFDSETLEELVNLKCFANPPNYLLATIGSRWLAYASCDHVKVTVARGTLEKKNQAPSKSVSGVAKDIAAGLYSFGDAAISWYFSTDDPASAARSAPGLSDFAGNVVIRDLKRNKVVAHFRAHETELSLIKFDPSGTLLVTAPSSGQYLNVYQVVAFPEHCRKHNMGSDQICKHLYKISRGITESYIRHISFSFDGRWLCVNSQKGSSHIYAMNRCGGKVDFLSRISDDGSRDQKVTLSDEYFEPNVESLSQTKIMRHKFRGAVVSAFETQTLSKYPGVISFMWTSRGEGNSMTLFTMHSSGSKPDKLSLFGLKPVRSTSSDKSNSYGSMLSLDSKEVEKWNITEFVSNGFQQAYIDEKSTDDEVKEEFVSEPVFEDSRSRWMAQIELQTHNMRNSFVPLWNSPRFSFHGLVKVKKDEIVESKSNFVIKYEPVVTKVEHRRAVADVEDFDPADLEPGMEIGGKILEACTLSLILLS